MSLKCLKKGKTAKEKFYYQEIKVNLPQAQDEEGRLYTPGKNNSLAVAS